MMKDDQQLTPLFDKLVQFSSNNPISFHVPGHKDGKVFPASGLPFFKDILKIDKTELNGLDDLHAADGVINKAQLLAADYFQTDQTFFLVGGSTSGNLAMILAVCGPDDTIIVQRNSHKSIMNALELSGARPVFVSSEFDERTNRYGNPSLEAIKEALAHYPNAKGLVLTYPDYYGKTYYLQEVIDIAHQQSIPVLIDEAHGVHFSSSPQFPPSALELGADVIVHSAHKMAPAMTMASYLHTQSAFISKQRIAHYLQILQSSSPSYPIMASLDLARAYLASLSEKDIHNVVESANLLREKLNNSEFWEVIFPEKAEDPLKITIAGKGRLNMKQVAELFEKEGIFPELATEQHILFLHGLTPFTEWAVITQALENIEQQLKNRPRHATIETRRIPQNRVQQLVFSYQEMRTKQSVFVYWQEAEGKVAAESVIPYPPGIPLILKGERITKEDVSQVEAMVSKGINFQNKHIKQGIEVFLSGLKKGE